LLEFYHLSTPSFVCGEYVTPHFKLFVGAIQYFTDLVGAVVIEFYITDIPARERSDKNSKISGFV